MTGATSCDAGEESNKEMAQSGNGRVLMEVQGKEGTQLRLTLATDPATERLRLDLRWWKPSQFEGRDFDSTARGAAIPCGTLSEPSARHIMKLRDVLDEILTALEDGRVHEYLEGAMPQQPALWKPQKNSRLRHVERYER